MSGGRITRRGLLVAAAAATVLPPARRERFVWRGSALGGEAQITLDGPRDAAEDAARAASAEIVRLERLFSLHRADSQLSRLNRKASPRLSATPWKPHIRFTAAMPAIP